MASKWDCLTPEQEILRDDWKRIGMMVGTNTTPIDHNKARRAINNFLKKEINIKEDLPITWVPSISAGVKFIQANTRMKRADLWKNLVSPQEEMYWISYYMFAHEAFSGGGNKYIPLKYMKADLYRLKIWFELAKNCYWFWVFSKGIVASERPLEIHFEEETSDGSPRRLHNIGGPAVQFSDGSSIYLIRGVRVTKEIAHGNFSTKDILDQGNAEVRRVMLDMYGGGRFIEDTGAKELHTDSFGSLYSVDVGEEEPLMMVRVVNTTPEPDGSHKIYWLTVDPNAYGGLTTARAAVASTWRKADGSLLFKEPEDYRPAFES